MLIDISKYDFSSSSNIDFVNVVPGTEFIAGQDSNKRNHYYICFKFNNASSSIITRNYDSYLKLTTLLSYASQYTEREIHQYYPELLI